MMSNELYKQFENYNMSKMKDDILAGLTVAITLIPQASSSLALKDNCSNYRLTDLINKALAFSVIAGLPPITGLYASLYPLIIYVVFCTSRHLSIGPFSITCLLIGDG